MIYLSSLLIPLLALLPNIFFAAAGGARGNASSSDRNGSHAGLGRESASPTGRAAGLLGAGGAAGGEPLPFVLLERVGQVGVFLSPILYSIHFESLYDIIALCGMALSLGLYYACWTRYFAQGRARALLVKSFLGIPIPMAIAPCIYFLFAAQIQRSPILVIAALLFAGGHIPITLIQRREVK
ncbi:MAG TPA: hypothetical protein VMW69_15205 [Spirochaetia bacterium]|nr:hypothetical protein [Spirochaetia bacterium]